METLTQSPPQSPEAESSVLGSIMLSPDCLSEVSAILKPEHFYSRQNATLYKCLLWMAEKGQAIDVVTVREAFAKRNRLDEIGGELNLSEIVTAVPSAANAEHYAHLVRDKALLRGVLSVAHRLTQEACESTEPVTSIIASAAQSIEALLEGEVVTQDTLSDVLTRVLARLERREQTPWIRTGFGEIDRVVALLRPGRVTLLTGLTSAGKTTVALNIARHAALVDKLPTCYISYEQDPDCLVGDMLSTLSGVLAKDIDLGTVRIEDYGKLSMIAGEIAEAPLRFAESLSFENILAQGKLHVKKHGMKLLVLDHVHLTDTERSYSNDTARYQAMSRGLKRFAKEQKVALLVLCQMNRGANEEQGMNKIKGSSAFEQDADVVILLKDEQYREPGDVHQLHIKIEKNRNEEAGRKWIYDWHRPTKSFALHIADKMPDKEWDNK